MEKIELNANKSPRMNLRRNILNLKWAKTSIENRTTKDLFQLNSKPHEMTTRKIEKYKVTMANTERLKK